MENIKYSFVIMFLFGFIHWGCDSNMEYKQIRYSEFPVVQKVTREMISAPPVLDMVGGMICTDDFIVTVDLVKDTFFHVFNRSDFNYLGGFVIRGQGPEEEVFINPFLQSIGQNEFIFQTNMGIKSAKLEMTSPVFTIDRKIYFPSSLSTMNHTFLIGETVYGWTMNDTSNQEYISYDISKNRVRNLGPNFPNSNMDIPVAKRSIVFAKASTVKPDNSKVASVYDKFPMLRIYDNNLNIISQSEFLNKQKDPIGLIKRNPTKEEIDEIMQNYRKVKSTNRYIFALYIGKTTLEMSGSALGLNDFSNIIHVWDWSGEPIKELILDHQIFSFCVSHNDDFIYATSLEENSVIYRYNTGL